jgi:sister-chromatid-cohesion protein PDS5
MQLQAAVSLLHLSTVEVYANAIAPKFVDLAITVQVSSAAYRCTLTLLCTLLASMLPSPNDFPD